MENIIIDINNDVAYPSFIISGRFNELLNNKRLSLSFNRLNVSIENESFKIPYREESQVKTLQEIERLLVKFGYKIELSINTKKDLESYDREEKLFEEFSEKARSIRNNEFDKNEDLVNLFNVFQSVIKEKLKRKLYPLQLLSSFHMAFAQNSCNFAVPGAGKTSIVYGAYAYLNSLPKDNPQHVDKLVVIGPLSSFAPWENEYKDCFGRSTKSFRMSGDIDLSKNQKLEHLYSSNPAELTLIFHGGVESFQNDIIDFLKRHKTMLVVDEAHRIKNPEGVWGKSVTEISKEAISRVILTGTPVPNGYQDIFNLYKFIYPFKFKEILKLHFQNLEDMTINSLPESSRVQELKENISPYFIRIKKVDLGLPPIEENIISIEMDPYQREIYDFIENQYIENFKENNSGTIKDVLNKAKLIRLRQASTNPALLSKTLKDSLENNFISGEFDPNSIFTTDNDEFVNDSEFFDKICNYSNFEVPKKFVEILKIVDKEILPNNGKVIIWTISMDGFIVSFCILDKNNIRSLLKPC